VLRVLIDEGVHLPGRPPRDSRAKRPFPEWSELVVPGAVWIYDLTHFRPANGARSRRSTWSRGFGCGCPLWFPLRSPRPRWSRVHSWSPTAMEHLLDVVLLDKLAHGVVPDNDELVR
jgi:hypothetical protein